MPITDEMLRTMGLIAVSAAKLENITVVLARELIDKDPRVGRAAMGGDPGFARVVTQIVPLAEARGLPDPLIHHFKSAALTAKLAMEERNKLLHSHWMSGDDDTPVQARREGKNGNCYLEVTVEDMKAIFMELSRAESEMRRLWVKLTHELGRAESDERGRVVQLPNRWSEAVTRRSPSRTWSAEDRWARGLAEWDEVELERKRRADESV